MENNKKPGKSSINWMPRTKCVMVADDERNDADKKRMSALGLIDISDLSDKERLNIGSITKSAELANTAGEEQKPYKIIAVGAECESEIGDVVLFQVGCQGTSIKVDGVSYLQLGEYEVLGKFL